MFTLWGGDGKQKDDSGKRGGEREGDERTEPTHTHTEDFKWLFDPMTV